MQFVLPNVLLKDILKLPLLVAHYFKHSHESVHHRLTDFIAEHYSTHDHEGNNNEDHENLPFHNNGPAAEQSFFVGLLTAYPKMISDISFKKNHNNIFAKQHFFPSAALSSIWRPPRSV